ncbi:MAG: hypothetical protein QXP98_04650 [Thermoproteus sp.]
MESFPSMKIIATCYKDPLRRAWGLMLRRPKPVLLVGVNSIHTFFMRSPIWAVFLDENMRALSVVLMRPWRIHREPRAKNVLEIPLGEKPPKIGEFVEVFCV